MAPWWDERAYALDGIGPRRQAFNHTVMQALGRLEVWFQRHWLAVVNAGLGTFIGLAVAAPVMRTLGLVGPSQAILSTYHIFCAQTPSHSLYLAGHQVCLCERCLAIYCSMLLGGLLLALMRGRSSRLQPLDWRLWLFAMIPMALDGGTQLFGLRESNVALRVITGCLFGLATAWFALPQINQAAATPALAPAGERAIPPQR
jgi:uncharacterized membrane protein